MINDIIAGISKKLYATFGENYPVYVEDVEQYLQEPCFCITHVTTSQQRISTYRYITKNLFDILFFAADGQEKKNQMHTTANKLFDALEYIQAPVNDTLNGINMRYEIVDGVLHFFVNYDIVLIKKDDDNSKMEQKTVNVGVKE